MSVTGLFFRKVAIMGVGLIGASFALALREGGRSGKIHGCGRKEEHLRAAKQRGIIDAYTSDVREACIEADLVVLATPVGAFRGIVQNVKDVLTEGAIVTDVGSVKGGLVSELESLMPRGCFFVGGHPIAGGETSGIDEARPDLFQGARCILTPTGRTDGHALDEMAALWRSLGAVVESMDPFAHDEIYAVMSHFPHLVAYALMNAVDGIDTRYAAYAGKGFRDATRIALSSPELWRDIAVMNSENLLRVARVFRESLDRMTRCLEQEDGAGLEREFSRARQLRTGLS
ncbi:MAG TPA: prephenate dehydrogenase/arogenate dehydrogenase family protein [Dissulfurispiraceae bacterium]|nr:prephenate dehydrogenase/arogenate dehydrogenase family protein [Dissulfurispiraceae bacterium]